MTVVGFAVDCFVVLDALVEDDVEVVIVDENEIDVAVDFLSTLSEADGTTEVCISVLTAEDAGSTDADVPVSKATDDPDTTIVDALVLTTDDSGSIETVSDTGSTAALEIGVVVDVFELIADDDNSEEVGVFVVLVVSAGCVEVGVFVMIVEDNVSCDVLVMLPGDDGSVKLFEANIVLLTEELGSFVAVDFVNIYVDGVGGTLFAQCEPVQSFEHTHENISGVFVQEPLFKHWDERHSSISLRQCIPVNPVTQSHLKLPCVFKQLP